MRFARPKNCARTATAPNPSTWPDDPLPGTEIVRLDFLTISCKPLLSCAESV